MTAPGFEVALRDREKQKHLFDYIGAGSITPKFLIDKNFKEQNNKLTVKYFPLQTLYKSEDKITKEELETFVEENKDQLKQEYIDFSYVLVNPKNLVGLDEFNQAFFDKIDFIENEISKDVDFNSILSNLELEPTTVKDFSLSNTPKEIEDKIFNAKSEKTGLLENNNDYILYNIDNVITKSHDLTNEQSVSDMKIVLNLNYHYY